MEMKEVEKRRTLMVRMTAPVGDLPRIMGDVFGELGSYMGRKGIDFAGPPYALYRNMDMEALDVEMGFPVNREDIGEGRIKPGELPAGTIATALHTGPYSRLEETYGALMAYVGEKGKSAEEWMYEFYLNSPGEVEPEELQTEICFPLK